MFGSTYCFLICIQVLQEVGKVVWYAHLFKNFPQFIVSHRGKGFTIFNEVEVDGFLEIPCFFYDLMDMGNLMSGSSAFSKSSLNIWKFLVHILLKSSMEDFEHDLASRRNECNCVVGPCASEIYPEYIFKAVTGPISLNAVSLCSW